MGSFPDLPSLSLSVSACLCLSLSVFVSDFVCLSPSLSLSLFLYLSPSYPFCLILPMFVFVLTGSDSYTAAFKTGHNTNELFFMCIS